MNRLRKTMAFACGSRNERGGKAGAAAKLSREKDTSVRILARIRAFRGVIPAMCVSLRSKAA